MRPALLGCTALASTLVMACTDASAPTVAAEAGSVPTADLVTRISIPFFDAFADGEFAVVMGVSREGLAVFCNGDESGLDQIHFQQVSRPDGSLKRTVRSRPRLLIYPLGDATGACDLVSSTPLASGKAQLNETDNDVTVTFNRTNSFGSHLTGNAAGEGGRFKVRAQFRITIHRNGEFQVHAQRFGITRFGN